MGMKRVVGGGGWRSFKKFLKYWFGNCVDFVIIS